MSASRDQADRTQRVELPSEEIGPVPVSIAHAEPRWFGIPPPLALLLLATVSLAIALALFATSHWPYGLILLGLAALLFAAFLEVARRRPESRLTSYAAGSAAAAREHAAAALDRLIARSSAAAESQRIRGAQAVIESDRRAALLRLGEAVHRDDGRSADAARVRLAELEAMEEELRARLAQRLAFAEERIQRSRLSVQRTMVVVPEPYPPPDEGTPPTPAPVPEPSPNPKPEPEPDPDEDTRRPAA
jgi:hypothetical protein